jgi:hypothetical protein
MRTCVNCGAVEGTPGVAFDRDHKTPLTDGTSVAASTSAMASSSSSATANSSVYNGTCSLHVLPSTSPAERRVYVMTYPADCSGTEFQTAVDKNIEALRSETRPFALVNDCRVVRYSTLDMRLPFLDWGRSVLGFGVIERVAFVVGEGAWLATLNGMLRLSPVQPARIFSAAPGDNLDEAERWSQETIIRELN